MQLHLARSVELKRAGWAGNGQPFGGNSKFQLLQFPNGHAVSGGSPPYPAVTVNSSCYSSFHPAAQPSQRFSAQPWRQHARHGSRLPVRSETLGLCLDLRKSGQICENLGCV